SRRRHTRFSRDWSSDVCSSDLLRIGDAFRRERLHVAGDLLGLAPLITGDEQRQRVASGPGGEELLPKASLVAFDHRVRGVEDRRSEERRVGNGGSARCVAWY